MRFVIALCLTALLTLAPPALAGTGDGEVEVEGAIEALTAASITVHGVTFAVTEDTEVRDENERPIAFSELTVGQYAEVEGYADAAGDLIAEEIELDDAEDEDDAEVEGVITARDGDLLTVGSLPVRLTATTRIDGDGDPTEADLTVGTRVEVRGYIDAAGTFIATRVEIEDAEDGDEDEDVEVKGPIEVLTPTSLTVRGITFAITERTRIEREAGDPEELAVGQLVEVEGVYDASGTLVATEIEFEDFEDDEVELTGTIEALGADRLTVAGLEFLVTSATVILDDDRRAIAFGDLTVGLLVEIRADVNAAGERVASHIKIEDGPGEDEVEVKAAIDALGDGVVVVVGKAFSVSPSTEILSRGGAPILFGDLAAGQVVEIEAALLADGALAALRIQQEDTPASEVRLKGPLTASAADLVVIVGVPFTVDGATVVLDADGHAIAPEAIPVGSRVEVDAVVTAAGFRATHVEVKRAARASGVVAASGGSAFTGSSFRLAGLDVALDARTVVLSSEGTALRPADLAVGQTVEVFGTTSGTTVTADRVVILKGASSVPAEGGPQARPLAAVAFPNPATRASTIRYSVEAAASVTVTTFDALGRVVSRTQVVAPAAGDHDLALDTSGLPGGVYLVRVEAPDHAAATVRLTVAR